MRPHFLGRNSYEVPSLEAVAEQMEAISKLPVSQQFVQLAELRPTLALAQAHYFPHDLAPMEESLSTRSRAVFGASPLVKELIEIGRNRTVPHIHGANNVIKQEGGVHVHHLEKDRVTLTRVTTRTGWLGLRRETVLEFATRPNGSGREVELKQVAYTPKSIELFKRLGNS